MKTVEMTVPAMSARIVEVSADVADGLAKAARIRRNERKCADAGKIGLAKMNHKIRHHILKGVQNDRDFIRFMRDWIARQA